MPTDAIYRYFCCNYGEVKRIEYHTHPEYRFAIVKFHRPSDALRASALKQHTIAGHIVNVSMPDQIHRKCYLLSLNDHCIIEILKRLEWEDLCAISDVCSRLADLAQTAFSSKYNNKVFKMIINGHEVEVECLRKFGPHIRSICLDFGRKQQRFSKADQTPWLLLLLQHLKTLHTLELRFFRNLDEGKIAPLLARLHKFSQYRCGIFMDEPNLL